MSRVRSLLAVAVLGVGAWALTARAEEPVAPASDEAARVRHLIDDLGSDDFRVREGAQKALAGFGERALPALREARSHQNPEVRFRAEQLVRQLEGAKRERPLRSDGPDEGRRAEPRGGSGWDRGLGFGDDELARRLERLLQDQPAWAELDRRMAELEKLLRDGGMGFGPGFRFGTATPGERVFERNDARLQVKPDGVRLSVEVEDDDGEDRHLVLEAESVEAMREKVRNHETLRDHPDVASVLRQSRRLDRRMPGFSLGVPGQSGSVVRGLQIHQDANGVKVTLTENGPDGKPVTKTYEGKDLETIKREHPEIASHLGGLRFEFGPDVRPFPFPGFGPMPDRPRPVAPPPPLRRDDDDDDATDDDDRDDDDSMDDEDDDVVLEPQSGPFGISIGPVDESLRLHLGLGEDAAARVLYVRPGSPAATMGLQAHDLILSVDGPSGKVSGGGPDALAQGLRGADKAGSLTIEVLRTGKPLRLTR